MAGIVLVAVCGGIGLLVANVCNNKRKNNKIIKKLKKEMKKLELVILKRIRNIRDIELRNIIINSEIDEYKYKTKCHCRMFDNSLELYEDGIHYQISGIWNDWNIGKYNFKNNLKMKMMHYQYYKALHNQKLNRISELFEKSTDETKVTIFKHYEEYIVYRNYKKNQRILHARNRALRNGIPHGGFVRLNYIDEVDEPESFEAGCVGRRGPLGLF